ncbi:MAG: methyltransferase domain-containing protein [Planctomycetaceae bacterium]|nr:methyltransferase domain-containing protein [Planctomycetaceae bacterium]
MARKGQAETPLGGQYEHMASHVPAGTDRAASLRVNGYSADDTAGVPEGSVKMGMGCGNPAALAALRPGQIVLDLGAGSGLDAFIAAKKVGAKGKVIGVDATPAMVERATAFAAEGGYGNVEFRHGQIEHLPLGSESIDVIISNCVINHARDKAAAFKEAHRVLKPNGEICITDLVVEGTIGRSDDPGMKIWEEWLAVACGKKEYLAAMNEAGFRDVVVRETAYAGQAMISALNGKIISLHINARK